MEELKNYTVYMHVNKINTGAKRGNIQKCLRGERHTAGICRETNQRLHWEKVEK